MIMVSYFYKIKDAGGLDNMHGTKHVVDLM
jgi:hypothetical protein